MDWPVTRAPFPDPPPPPRSFRGLERHPLLCTNLFSPSLLLVVPLLVVLLLVLLVRVMLVLLVILLLVVLLRLCWCLYSQLTWAILL